MLCITMHIGDAYADILDRETFTFNWSDEEEAPVTWICHRGYGCRTELWLGSIFILLWLQFAHMKEINWFQDGVRIAQLKCRW